MKPKQEPDWRWPEQGTSNHPINVRSIRSPYGQDGTTPATCYPGTPLEPSVSDLVTKLCGQQLNAIGTHTHGTYEDGVWKAAEGEGGFGDLAKAERLAIWMVASRFCESFNDGPPEWIDGHFCGGGTEANLSGIWMARQWLRRHPDPHRHGIVVLATPLVHYSIAKAVEITDIGQSHTQLCTRCGKPHILLGDTSGSGMTYVGMNHQGEMDVNDLNRVIQLKLNDGFRRFIITPTVGTTALGSVDPIKEINELVERLHQETTARFYVHVDASFGGFTMPFLKENARIGFENSTVMSMAIDADKMGHLPYPAGIFLCRKDLQRSIGRKVAYVRGHEDDTVPGSRSALAPLIAYDLYRTIGVEGQRQFVKNCMSKRDLLWELLKEIKDKRLNIGPVPKWTNFLPIEVELQDGAIPKSIHDGTGPLSIYHLRSDYVPCIPTDVRSCPREVYKLCVMPHHTTEHLAQFANDLAAVIRTFPKD